MTAVAGSLAAATMRSLRSRKSIIGCGRPTVNSSSPRSTTVCFTPSWVRMMAASWASVPRGVLQRGGGGGAHLADDRGIAAEKIDDHRLSGGAGDVEDVPGHGRGGGLGDEDDDAGARVGGEPLHAGLHHDAAHAFVEIVSAHADHLREALAESIDQARHLLETRARGAYEADAPTADRIGEAERYAVQDGRAAVRSHHEEALLRSELLQLDLVRHRHVVAEDEGVEAALERL